MGLDIAIIVVWLLSIVNAVVTKADNTMQMIGLYIVLILTFIRLWIERYGGHSK